ncbi:AAA family ATPase [Homoserinibacter sp. YIM 151385]|uniref:AAA family ATPase n=1 Tax=Homoserinibacter sp. YIM 151385 TaxID=2985506 RepID=UPI0022F0EE10|nr:ATP-binding protein [Homoserinibacter sp. YIM 151385]WBU38294.1 ATP-binding protein [Homoserinibacter sp. YIM 151385]
MLVVFAGLPGSGKSTISEVVGNRLGMPVVSVDPIESSILRAGIDSDQPTGLAAYLVAETLAESVLASSGPGVIVDAVNAVEPAREQWLGLAERQSVPLRFIEVVCSDEELHRERLETRTRTNPQLREPGWHLVEQALDEWQDWSGLSAAVPRITLDSSRALGENVDQAIAFLAS